MSQSFRSDRVGSILRRACQVLALLVVSVAHVAMAHAAPSPQKQVRGRGGNFGLGLSHGDPMGVSGKLFLHPSHALQFDLGWAPMHHGGGRLGADYLWHPATFVRSSVVHFGLYLGVGLGVAFWANRYHYGARYHGTRFDRRDGGGAGMFLRAPIVGLFLHWQKIPLDTVLESSWSPFLVLPDLSHGDVSAKVRYYF